MSGDSFKIRKPIPPETMFGSYRFVEQISSKECNCICTLCNNQKIVLRQDLVSGKATKCADCYNKERNEKKQNNIKKEKEHQVNCDYCGNLFSRTKYNEKRSHKLVGKNACTNEACRLEKRKETNLLLRGKPYASQCDESKEKVKNAWTAKTDDQLKEINEKREDTMFENHGVKNASQLESVKDKVKQTSSLNWGVENPMQNELVKKKVADAWGSKTAEELEEIINKVRKAWELKTPEEIKEIVNKVRKAWESKTPEDLEEIANKIRKAWESKTPEELEEIANKTIATNIKNLGVEYTFNSPEIQEKIKQTNIKNLGVENPFNSPEIQEKIKQTNVKNLGVENPLSSPEIQEKGRLTKLKKYGTAHPNIHFGKTQKEIQEFLNSFGCSFLENDYSILGSKEIDLYDCNKKIAIEYCGLYWHTDLSPEPRDKNYHYDKHIKCLQKGVNLITIFEDEWVNRNSQCKNVLKSILGIYDLRVYARKCTIVKLEKQEFHDFCDEYHLQGKNTLGQIFYGLKHENTLVAAMSFGRHHRNNHDLVLDRFCCKGDVQVVGGASRLFKACLAEAKTLGFKKVISWSDNRWRQGTVYEQLGFTLEKELGPDFSYVYLKNTKNKRISKQSMKKKNTNCPPDMTEKVWAILNSLGRIYDCGKKRWVHNIQ